MSLAPTVLHEDEKILVLDKPAGLIVNRADSIRGRTMQDWIEQRLAGDKTWEQGRGEDAIFAERSGMVHRLDKDTSGVIIFAKTSVVMHELMRQFKEREVEKSYLALVHGHPKEREGLISVGIERHPHSREIFTVSATGRPAVTKFMVQQEFSSIDTDRLRQANEQDYEPVSRLSHELKLYEDGFTRLELQPRTGRTHQLRVHLKFIHHPIVGDDRYVGRKRWRLDRLWCPRQWLHAQRLKIPGRGEWEAPVPEDLEEALGWLS